MVVAAVNEIVELPLRAAVFKTGPKSVVTAAIERDFAAGIERAVFGLNIHHPRRAEAVLGGQRAGDQRNVLDEARVQFQAKAGDAFGQEHAVNAILQIGVLAAHVQIPVLRRILRHAGKTGDDLIDRRVGPLWNGQDLRLVLDRFVAPTLGKI